MRRLDAPSRVEFLRDASGALRCRARIARAGVQAYQLSDGSISWELRPDSEVFADAAMASFEAVPVTIEHPAGGAVTSANYREVARGAVSCVARDAENPEWLGAVVSIVDAEAIIAIEAGTVQLSGGYSATRTPHDPPLPCTASPTGLINATITNIRGNHVALTDAARAGPGARLILDSMPDTGFAVNPSTPEEVTMLKCPKCGADVPVTDACHKKDSEPVTDSVWSTAQVNDLPDSAFLFVEAGGTKDASGKTEPRSLRHFPYRGPDGAIDLPHLRNAIARIPQSDAPGLDKEALQSRAQEMLANTKNDSAALPVVTPDVIEPAPVVKVDHAAVLDSLRADLEKVRADRERLANELARATSPDVLDSLVTERAEVSAAALSRGIAVTGLSTDAIRRAVVAHNLPALKLDSFTPQHVADLFRSLPNEVAAPKNVEHTTVVATPTPSPVEVARTARVARLGY